MSDQRSPRLRIFRRLWSLHALLIFSGLMLWSCGGDDPGKQWVEELGYDDAESFAIKLDRFGGPVVPITIRGKSIDATFDTGNMIGLLLSSDLATSLQLPASGTRELRDSEGNTVGTIHRFQIDTLNAFDRDWTSVSASEYSGNAMSALIGPRYVRGGRFTIDYPHKRMAVSQSSTPDTAAAGTPISMIASSRFPDLILVAGHINGHPTVFQIDTGKSRSCVHPDWAQLCRLPETRDGYRIDSLEIGGHTFTVRSAKPMRFTELERGVNQAIKGAIGADVLSEVRITVDYKRDLVYIYQTPPAEEKPST